MAAAFALSWFACYGDSFPREYHASILVISLTFKNGRVIKASAVKGEDMLKEILKVENADRIGEAAIGTNCGITRFTKEILFDEKMGGTIHLALGHSYFESGGLNQSGVTGMF